MNTGRELNLLNKCFAFVCMFLFFAVSSFAADNSLSGVDIKQSSGNGYQIFLKLDKKAQIKKIVENNDNLVLVVNSALPSESMEIVYDSEDNLSNVIVQKKNDGNILISVQGRDIANAEIFTKELSTGITKTLDTNENLLNNLFFVADKKVLCVTVLGTFLFFFLMLAVRPKNARYSSENINRSVKSNKNIANTLRNKNLVQSKSIPSINYKVNGSFDSVNSYSSIPKDFVINKHSQTTKKEQIRKAG